VLGRVGSIFTSAGGAVSAFAGGGGRGGQGEVKGGGGDFSEAIEVWSRFRGFGVGKRWEICGSDGSVHQGTGSGPGYGVGTDSACSMSGQNGRSCGGESRSATCDEVNAGDGDGPDYGGVGEGELSVSGVSGWGGGGEFGEAGAAG